MPQAAPEAPAEQAPAEPVFLDQALPEPAEFIEEARDANTRVYRAADHEGAMLAAFYGDGRVRLADERFRFAGMVQNAHAHLLDIASENWSELFLRMTPEGVLQLELRDGPYDARILTCEPAA